jgi:hypothetical protein
LNLEAALFITDPIPKIIKDTCQQENETFNWMHRMKRAVTLGVLGSLGGTFSLPNFLITFPWVIDHVPILPQNQTKQILAITIND